MIHQSVSTCVTFVAKEKAEANGTVTSGALRSVHSLAWKSRSGKHVSTLIRFNACLEGSVRIRRSSSEFGGSDNGGGGGGGGGGCGDVRLE